jgi:hypothetical protein
MAEQKKRKFGQPTPAEKEAIRSFECAEGVKVLQAKELKEGKVLVMGSLTLANPSQHFVMYED